MRAVVAAHEILLRETIPKAAAELDKWVRVASDMPYLTYWIHKQGINERYIPELAALCKEPKAKRWLAQECITRAAKHSMRALWAREAKSSAHAVALAENVIARLERGEEWQKLRLPAFCLPELPPTLKAAKPWESNPWNSNQRWDELLRIALRIPGPGQDPAANGRWLLHAKVKSVSSPPFVPPEQLEQMLLQSVQFRRAAGGDDLVAQLRLLSVYRSRIALPGGAHNDFVKKGEQVAAEVAARHRRGPPRLDALRAAAQFHLLVEQFKAALPLYVELVKELRATKTAEDETMADVLHEKGAAHEVTGHAPHTCACWADLTCAEPRGVGLLAVHQGYCRVRRSAVHQAPDRWAGERLHCPDADMHRPCPSGGQPRPRARPTTYRRASRWANARAQKQNAPSKALPVLEEALAMQPSRSRLGFEEPLVATTLLLTAEAHLVGGARMLGPRCF